MRSPVPTRSPDTADRAQAITVITPLKRLGMPRTRLSMGVALRFPQIMGLGRLKSVYFTRWSILTQIPYNGAPQVPDGLAQPLLVWESTFHGVMEPYIEAFVYVVGRRINRTWGAAYGFPGVRSVAVLKRYIEKLAIPGAYYYSAYPRATVRMVTSALEIDKEHRFLREAARTASPEEFAIIYRGFLSRRQGDL
jgi:hypothetical protein